MKITQLSAALSDLEGARLTPYWLFQNTARARTAAEELATGPGVVRLVHPLAVWLMAAGVDRVTLEGWQVRAFSTRDRWPAEWWHDLIAEYRAPLFARYGFDPLDAAVLCSIVESAPFLHDRGRRWGRGAGRSGTEIAPDPVPGDVARAWDAAVRIELGEYYRRILRHVEVIHVGE